MGTVVSTIVAAASLGFNGENGVSSKLVFHTCFSYFLGFAYSITAISIRKVWLFSVKSVLVIF